MVFFFEWLAKAKGVRHIINIQVDDWQKPSHSEESIMSVFKSITVDNMDWQRLDLDPLVMCEKLRKVDLYWSGNNAVLRAWSEPEGLPRLPLLTKVSLHIPNLDETLESQNWMEMNVDKFRRRLNENVKNYWQKLETTTSEQMDHGEAAKDSASHRDSAIVDIVRDRGNEPQLVSVIKHVAAEHRWLDTIDNFAHVMANMWSSIRRDSHPNETAEENSANGVRQDVVIALIDDGVDVLAPELSGRIVGGKSFDSSKPYYVSESGHGTVMACMIARVCPMAKLYPIRLKLVLDDEGKSRVDLKSAAWAIQAALDKNATIISMSWSFAGRLSSQERALMTDVLAIACDREVLMFCSAAEKGREDPTVFDNRLLCIGSASDDPDAAGSSSIDFIFPSTADVKLHDDSSRRPYSDNTHALLQTLTDSSVPTALGTGLAATLLYLFKAGELAGMDMNARDSDLPEISHVLLAKPHYMKAAFENLGKVTAGGIIQIWESLGSVIKVLEDKRLMSHEEKMVRMHQLCYRLLEPST